MGDDLTERGRKALKRIKREDREKRRRRAMKKWEKEHECPDCGGFLNQIVRKKGGEKREWWWCENCGYGEKPPEEVGR